MGVVYRALDTRLDRHVAVKLLPAGQADAAGHRALRPRSAATASGLNHPHILTVHDIGDFDGRQYLVTEFVDGGTLRDWAQAEPRTWQQVVDLLVGWPTGWRRHTRRESSTGTSSPRTSWCPGADSEAGRFRPGEGGRSVQRDEDRGHRVRGDALGHRDGHGRLHVARTGGRRARRRSQRYLLVRDRPLRATRAPASVRGRDRTRGAGKNSTHDAGAAARRRSRSAPRHRRKGSGLRTG